MTEQNLDQQDPREEQETQITDFKELFPTEIAEDLDTFDFVLTKKDGSRRECQLREFAGVERENFLRENSKKVGRDGKSITDFKDVQVILLRKTVFDKNTDKPLTDDELRNLPAKTQQMLYEMSIKMCGLDKEALLQAKKK